MTSAANLGNDVPPNELTTIHDTLCEGRAVNPVTVREFLSWFDAKRRGISIVARIREELESLQLSTVPDFEEPWIDGLIAFHTVRAAGTEGRAGGSSTAAAEGVAPHAIEETQSEPTWEHREAGYRLSRFQAANKPVVSITPDASLEQAVTTMMLNDFSQLPVMVGERDVKGVVTWSSIAMRTVLGQPGGRIIDYAATPIVLDGDASIFDAIQAIVQHDFVLVRDRERRIAGIVTAADLSLQFRALSEPFLLLSEIETHVRNMIGQTFTIPELVAARDPGSTHDVQSVTDLTFGEYVFLLRKPANWSRLGVRIDRASFCEQLDRVRTIRNQVMHFDPDGLDEGDIQILQEFSAFLKRVEAIGA